MSSSERYKIEITAEPLNVTAALSHVTLASCGGTSIFCGTTRDTFNDKRVLYLEYEAYEGMALKEITRICDVLSNQGNSNQGCDVLSNQGCDVLSNQGNSNQGCDVRRVYVAHRTGRVEVCETSIIVAASSPHRAQAINFVSQAVDRIKESVPVWKKEWYVDGSVWKENCRGGS